MARNPILEELDKAEIPVHETVNAFYAGTQALLEAAIPVRNIIMSLGNHRSELEDALAGTYFRMCLLMESLSRLNRPSDFQVALHCARCMYESYIDVALLLQNPADVAKFNAFTFVSRYSAAKKLVNELDLQKITDASFCSIERTHVADSANAARFDSERAKYWPSKKLGKIETPSHWTDANLYERAKLLGKQEALRYRKIYSYLCWYSHSGVVGVANVSNEGLEGKMGAAHAYVQDFFYETTILLGGQFQIFIANSELRKTIDRYKGVMAKVLAQYWEKTHSNTKA